jgi:ribonuclease HII
MPDMTYELEKYALGYTAVCGCDEAGRGPLCGSVVAAAVILPVGEEIEGLNDSKKLTEKKREKLFDIIKEKAIAYAVAEATPEEIDQINILNASMLAMKRAVDAGYWTLYRYNPMLENPMTLDSGEPTMDYEEFLKGEVRYSSLTRTFPENAESMFREAGEMAKEKYEKYKNM